MKQYIFILAMLMQAFAINAQKNNGIRELMQYLEKEYPEGVTYRAIRANNDLWEDWAWKKEYDNTKDHSSVRYRMQLLKDTVLQYFVEASANAVACHHQQTPNGTEDNISYAVALANNGDDDPTLVNAFYDYHYNADENASFYYRPDRNFCILDVKYGNTTEVPSSRKVLDFKPIKPMVEKIAQSFGGQAYKASYRYNVLKDPLADGTVITHGKEDESGKMNAHYFTGGDRIDVIEGACSGTLYVIPEEKADEAAHTLNRQVMQYLQSHNDQQYMFDYSNQEQKKTTLRSWVHVVPPYGTEKSTPEHLFARIDSLGRYTILFIDYVDSTFALPRGYETMLSYDHGKIERVPDYTKPTVEKRQKPFENLLEKFVRELGIDGLFVTRTELIGGRHPKTICTYQSNVDKKTIDEIRRKLAKSPLGNILHKETHTAMGDTLELTAEEKASKRYSADQHLVCKFYGKDNQQNAYMKYLITQADSSLYEMPFDTRWVDKYIAQMKDSAWVQEHPIVYEYGDKKDPSSMGRVEGRLYDFAFTNADCQKKLGILHQNMYTHLFSNKNQSYDIVIEQNRTRITDKILFWNDQTANQYRLLIIDRVEGKFLIPEDWPNILTYKYGKKTYLKPASKK